jgi:flagellin-like hook-associated protein FlgL
VVRGRTEIGLEMGRLDAATDRLTRTSERLTVDLARIEDADLLEVATALERIRLHLSAGLGATGQAETHTLFDVLA